MAMRMPRFLRSDHPALEPVKLHPPRLHAVGDSTADIVPFPLPATPEVEPLIPARAELRTRRFGGFAGADEERYEAKFAVAGSSPVELLRSLTVMLEEAGDQLDQSGANEPLVIDIRLVAGNV